MDDAVLYGIARCGFCDVCTVLVAVYKVVL